MDTSEREFKVVLIPQDETEEIREVAVHQPAGQALQCLIAHCKNHFAKTTLKPEQLQVFKEQVQEHSKGQEIPHELLERMAETTTCDVVILQPNKKESDYIAINMYVDDKGVSKQLGINRRATSIANECGKNIQIIGDAFVAKQFDDDDGFHRYDFTIKDLDTGLPWFKMAKVLNTGKNLNAYIEEKEKVATGTRNAKAQGIVYRERAKGNKCFQIKDYVNAITHYKRSLSALGLTEEEEPRIKELKLDEELVSKLYSNLSACYLKLEDYDRAIKTAKSSTEYKPDWAKAWGRLHDAHLGKGDLEAAKTALERASELSPHSEDLKQRQAELKSG